MKTIKYISILVLSACMAALSSCAEEDIVKKGTPGDGHTLLIELTADANREISPLSKASADDPQEKVTDLNILIYQNGSIVENESQYITSGEILTKLSQPSTTGNNASAPFTLTDIEPGAKVVYVVANAGKSLINDAGAATADNLKDYKFDMNGDKPQFVMFAEGQSFDVSSNASITSSLKRIYSMVTVKMEFDSKFNKNIQIIPQSVQLKHIPTTGQLKENNMINSSSECLIDGEKIEKGSSDAHFLLEDHSSATPLFLYENRQPKGKNMGDERTKTPAGISQATAMSEIIKTDRKCSYIEIVAQYIKSGNADGAGSGTITYRFFLGENATDNFDVQRNYHYKVTLSLTGDGGKDEATWRVEADLKKEMSIQDVYIGYVQGARSYVQATGDFEGATVSSNSDKISVSIDRNGKVTVISNETNTHDYNSRTFTYTYRVNGESKRANVIQVPRLVDPIAIFKNAKNTDPSVIKVKEYSKENKNYELLSSVGPWSATIESYSGSNACWFEIRNDEGSTDQQGGVIRGDGDVTFTYQPKSENNNNDRVSNKNLSFADDLKNVDKARYGVILVKYHNEQCEHRIYVRQGYQPTTMGGSVWSMFNCLGQQANRQQAYTSYPTETGWLFKGACDIAMSPYDPGYEVNPGNNLLCSDGQKRSFKNIPGSGPNEGVGNWVTSSGEAQRGPCPAGYRLASGKNFYDLFQSSTAYTGYVYDDDYPTGGDENDLPYGYKMGRSGHEIDPGTGNHCNPAKGSLLVSGSTSIFFTYGKGIKTKPADGDNNLINEIGVGHRGPDDKSRQSDGSYSRMGYLKYYEFLNWTSGNIKNHTYGAYYWGATKFNDSSDRLSRVNFSYDLLDPNVEESYVDWNPSRGHTGIDSYLHGSFVRCVRSN